MKSNPAKQLLIALVASLSTTLSAQTVLFEANFENDTAGGSPTLVADGGAWTFPRGANYVTDSVSVAEDSETFGATQNKFLHIVNAKHFDLIGRLSSPAEVVTLSFHFIGRNNTDARWSLMNFYGGDGTLLNNNNRAHVLSQSMISRVIRTDAGAPGNTSYGNNNVLLHWEIVMNNSASTITYNNGATLASGKASVWINGVQKISEYNFARSSGIGTGPIHGISIGADSTSSISMDIDNFKVLEGAHVTTPPTPVVLTVGSEGGQIKMNWPATAGKTYQVQFKNDLSSAWSDLGVAIVAASGIEEFSESFSEAKRFYRIKQVD